MEGVEWRGSIYRIRRCVFDLLLLEEDLIDDEDSWELLGSDLCLKSTFLYCDLSRVVSGARDDHKRTLTDLANKLFYCLEELGHAVKSRSMLTTQVRYNDTALVLREVVAAVVPPHYIKLGLSEEEEEDE